MNGSLIPHPVTGEAVELDKQTTTELADMTVGLGDLLGDLQAFRQQVVDEVARRLDQQNTRTAEVGDWKLETNAPSEQVFLLDELRDVLNQLVEAGVIDRAVVDRVIHKPPPKEPEPRVAKREVAKLERQPQVAEALAPIRRRKDNRRTLKPERIR